MSIFRVLLYIFLAVFIYKFVFGFLVPLVKVSLRVRSQIKDFQRQHQQQDPFQQQNYTANNHQSDAGNNSTAAQPKAGDYIDFEEVED